MWLGMNEVIDELPDITNSYHISLTSILVAILLMAIMKAHVLFLSFIICCWGIHDGITAECRSAKANVAANIRLNPIEIRNLRGEVSSVLAGDGNSFVIKNDGTLWAWGRNDYNQLGPGEESIIPMRIDGLDDIVQVAAGTHFTLALKSDGTVWALGRNNVGQLGDGTTTDSASPVQVASLTNVTEISTESDFSLALTADGMLWGWGNNSLGQIGLGSEAPTTITEPRRIVIDNSDSLLVTAMDAGYDHAIALTEDGKIWTWGENKSGQLATGNTTQYRYPVQVFIDDFVEAKAVAAGKEFSMTIAVIQEVDDSSPYTALFTWGGNRSGQLGDNSITSSTTPVEITTSSNLTSVSATYKSAKDVLDGTIYAWGNNQFGQIYLGAETQNTANQLSPRIVNLDNLIQLSIGEKHSLALLGGGESTTLVSWGYNDYGQLGVGAMPVKSFNTKLTLKTADLSRDTLTLILELPEWFNYEGLSDGLDLNLQNYELLLGAGEITQTDNTYAYDTKPGVSPAVALKIVRQTKKGTLKLELKEADLYDQITNYEYLEISLWVDEVGYSSIFSLKENSRWKCSTTKDSTNSVKKFNGSLKREDDTIVADFTVNGKGLLIPAGDFVFEETTPVFYIDGNEWETAKGSDPRWKKNGQHYSFKSSKGTQTDIKKMSLDFKNGKWSFQIKKASPEYRIGEGGSVSLGIFFKSSSEVWTIIDTDLDVDDGLSQKTTLRLIKK